MATRKDVAKLAGVSVATVSNVFSDKNIVSSDRKKQVLQAASELKYVPNFTARSLKLGRSSHIGITVNESTNPFHMEIISGIESFAMRSGYMVTVFMLDNHAANKIENIERRQLDALINYTTHEYPIGFIEELRRRNTLLVNFWETLGMTFHHHHYHSTYECLRKLSELGHRKIAYLSTVDRLRFLADERGQAYRAAVRDFGLVDSEDLIFSNDNYKLKSDEIGYLLSKQFLDSKCGATAFLAMNDLAAIGGMRALFDAGLDVPGDVSVVGCDDISLAKYYHPSISSIGFDKFEFGTNVARQIVRMLEEKDCGIGKHEHVETFPVFRESIGPCKN